MQHPAQSTTYTAPYVLDSEQDLIPESGTFLLPVCITKPRLRKLLSALHFASRARLFDETYTDEPDLDHLIDVMNALAFINDPENAPCMPEGSSMRAYRLFDCKLQYSDDGQTWIDAPNSQPIGACAEDGRTPELRTITIDSSRRRLEWKYTDEDANQWRTLTTITDGEDGTNGRTPELRSVQAADGINVEWKWTDEPAANWRTVGFVADGEDGMNGRTPQIRARASNNNDGWFIETKYADEPESAWTVIATLTNGEDGDRGERGEQGEPGRTPTLRANGQMIQWRYADEAESQWRDLIDPCIDCPDDPEEIAAANAAARCGAADEITDEILDLAEEYITRRRDGTPIDFGPFRVRLPRTSAAAIGAFLEAISIAYAAYAQGQENAAIADLATLREAMRCWLYFEFDPLISMTSTRRAQFATFTESLTTPTNVENVISTVIQSVSLADYAEWAAEGAWRGSPLCDDCTPPIPAPELLSVSFLSSSQTAQESAGSISIPVILSIQPTTAQTTAPITVDITRSGTAGIADASTPTSITFPAGSGNGSQQNVIATITDDTTAEPAETIELTLVPPPSVGLGSIPTHTITINTSDECPPAFTTSLAWSNNFGTFRPAPVVEVTPTTTQWFARLASEPDAVIRFSEPRCIYRVVLRANSSSATWRLEIAGQSFGPFPMNGGNHIIQPAAPIVADRIRAVQLTGASGFASFSQATIEIG